MLDDDDCNYDQSINFTSQGDMLTEGDNFQVALMQGHDVVHRIRDHRLEIGIRFLGVTMALAYHVTSLLMVEMITINDRDNNGVHYHNGDVHHDNDDDDDDSCDGGNTMNNDDYDLMSVMMVHVIKI